MLQASADPPPECFDTRELIAASRHADHLSAPLRGLRARLADELLGRHPTRDVLLHGDLVPANVVVTSAGPRLIDPIGRRGLPAFDFGQLAAAAEGRGVRRLLPALLEGYGERPALIDEIAAWEVLVYLDKNLSVPDSPAVPRLLPLAEALLELDDPARFVALHLT
jgi:Ser/Thr protein kinase RdoA (MazF antagonist)